MIVEIAVKVMMTARNMPCRLEWSKLVVVVELIAIESVEARTNTLCKVADDYSAG